MYCPSTDPGGYARSPSSLRHKYTFKCPILYHFVNLYGTRASLIIVCRKSWEVDVRNMYLLLCLNDYTMKTAEQSGEYDIVNGHKKWITRSYQVSWLTTAVVTKDSLTDKCGIPFLIPTKVAERRLEGWI
jgi:hypothetical protein